MRKKRLVPFVILLTAFVLWTVAVSLVDVRAIGPQASSVGFATLNGWVHRLTGVHFGLYRITDWLGLVPIALCAAFGILGLCQWVTRKSLCKVDRDILLLGGFYLLTMAVYILFEYVVINYRPVLIDGRLEASYPSSTTMLTLCVMPTAIMQLQRRMKQGPCKQLILLTGRAFTAFMVIGRLLSGVHWFSDIVGGVLLSSALVMLYRRACQSERI